MCYHPAFSSEAFDRKLGPCILHSLIVPLDIRDDFDLLTPSYSSPAHCQYVWGFSRSLMSIPVYHRNDRRIGTAIERSWNPSHGAFCPAEPCMVWDNWFTDSNRGASYVPFAVTHSWNAPPLAQYIAPLLIIYRVARGRAWSPSTNASAGFVADRTRSQLPTITVQITSSTTMTNNSQASDMNVCDSLRK